MNKSGATVAALLLASALGHAAPSPITTGDPFIKARKQLYAAGWREDPLAHVSSGEYMGLERHLVEDGYTEVDYCSEGRSYCIFQYIKGDACLRLRTQGEQIHLMKVDGWSSECRERKPDEEKNAPPADVRYLIQWRDDCELGAECQRTQRFLLKLKKKYRQAPVILQLLEAQHQ